MNKLAVIFLFIFASFQWSGCSKDNNAPTIVVASPSGPTRDNNMALGNPSNATTSLLNPDDYLLVKTQYALSYNNSRGEANWVCWHLSTAWKGDVPRCNCFTSDTTLPVNFYHALTSYYTDTGFDRGHLCPSEDRDGSDTDNAATFLMTNVMPQAPDNNRQTWNEVETYCDSLINRGNELYIIAGGYGSGGTGSNGGVSDTIADGHIVVPARVWKIVVVLTVGNNDVSRINDSTRVIAVDMPNTQNVNLQSWGYYRVSVDAIESNTGFDFLSNVPASIQNVIEARVDTGPTQ